MHKSPVFKIALSRSALNKNYLVKCSETSILDAAGSWAKHNLMILRYHSLVPKILSQTRPLFSTLTNMTLKKSQKISAYSRLLQGINSTPTILTIIARLNCPRNTRCFAMRRRSSASLSRKARCLEKWCSLPLSQDFRRCQCLRAAFRCQHLISSMSKTERKRGLIK